MLKVAHERICRWWNGELHVDHSPGWLEAYTTHHWTASLAHKLTKPLRTKPFEVMNLAVAVAALVVAIVALKG